MHGPTDITFFIDVDRVPGTPYVIDVGMVSVFLLGWCPLAWCQDLSLVLTCCVRNQQSLTPRKEDTPPHPQPRGFSTPSSTRVPTGASRGWPVCRSGGLPGLLEQHMYAVPGDRQVRAIARQRLAQGDVHPPQSNPGRSREGASSNCCWFRSQRKQE